MSTTPHRCTRRALTGVAAAMILASGGFVSTGAAYADTTAGSADHHAVATKLVIIDILSVKQTGDPGAPPGDELFFTLNGGPDPNENACENLRTGSHCSHLRMPLTAGDSVTMWEDDPFPIGYDDKIATRKITQAGNDWVFEGGNGKFLVDIARA